MKLSQREPDPPAGRKAERASDLRSEDEARPSSSDAAAGMNSSNGTDARGAPAAVDRANEADTQVRMDSGPVWPPRVTRSE